MVSEVIVVTFLAVRLAGLESKPFTSYCLSTKEDNKSLEELDAVEDELAEKYSENMFNKISEELEGI